MKQHMKRIILITGGQRSGKSAYAERRALALSPNPVYMATAHIWDDDFALRVKRHQERRGPEWTNIEEERQLSRHDVSGRVVLVDCVTLWLTNFLNLTPDPSPKGEGSEVPINVDRILSEAKREFDAFTQYEATFIFVTNEIGLGGVSENALQRRFADLQGWMNQYIASKADEVVMMVSGLEWKLKG